MRIVQLLIDAKANVKIGNKFGSTAFHEAVCSEKFEVLRLLVNSGDKEAINIQDKNGWTPLMEAAEKASVNIMELLLDNGANTKLANKGGCTALHNAVCTRKVEVVSLLLRRMDKEDIDIQDSNGWSPLMEAADDGQTSIMRLLCDAGASSRIRNKRGHTPLHKAVYSGEVEAVSLLLERLDRADLDVQDVVGMTPLMLAAKRRYASIVKLLLDKGADASVIDDKKNTALDFARLNKARECTAILKGICPRVRAYSKERSIRILLAHVFELEGTSKLSNPNPKKFDEVVIDLEGSYSPYMWLQVAKHTPHFVKGLDVNLAAEWKLIMDMFKGEISPTSSPTVLFEKYRENKPVFVQTGFIGHSVIALFWQKYLIICDRRESTESLFKLTYIKPEKVNEALIYELQNVKSSHEDEYISVLEDTLSSLISTDEDHLFPEIQSHLDLPFQKLAIVHLQA